MDVNDTITKTKRCGKVLALSVMLIVLALPFVSATSYTCTSWEYAFSTDSPSDTADQDYYNIFVGIVWYSEEGGISQWDPQRVTVADYPTYWIRAIWPSGQASTTLTLQTDVSGISPIYSDMKAMSLIFQTESNTGSIHNDYPSPSKPLAFGYFEGVDDVMGGTSSGDIPYFSDEELAQLNTHGITIDNPSTMYNTYTIYVYDSEGTPIPNAKVYLDLVNKSGSGITSENIGLAFKLLESYFDKEYGTSAEGGRLYLTTDNDGKVTLYMPKYVITAPNSGNDKLTYEFQLQAEYNSTQSSATTFDTGDGDTIVNIMVPVDTTPVTTEFIKISFYYDETLSRGVYLANYNITVMKAFSPDGLSSPATHTYEIDSYNTLKILVDDQYPYAVVTLKDAQGNVAFRKGYLMQADTYTEVLEGEQYLVKLRIYDVTNNVLLQNFSVKMVGEKASYTEETNSSTISILAVKGNYVVDFYDENDNLVYSIKLTVDQNIGYTAYTKTGFLEKVTLHFVDSSLTPVNINTVLNRYELYVYTESGYNVYLGRTAPFKYSLDAYFMNNKAYYYIYDSTELDYWNDGVYLKIVDPQTGTTLREYKLVLTSSKEFTILLPYIIEEDVDEAVPSHIPYIPPGESDMDEYRSEMASSVLSWFFEKGFFMVLLTLGVAFTAGDAIGRGAGIYIGLALMVVFTYLGMIPKSVGFISALGFTAVLLKELNVSSYLRGRGDDG